MSSQSDILLVEMLSKGDAKAFEQLFTRYFPKMKFFIEGLLSDSAEAENLSQDIFVKLWQNRENLTSVRNINAYLYRMAKNAVFNNIEHNILVNRFMLSHNNPDTYVYDEPITDELIAQEMQQLIELSVENMPTQRKLIFKMSRRDGLTNEEIAQQLKISKRTVETHICAALADLRKVMMSITLFF